MHDAKVKKPTSQLKLDADSKEDLIEKIKQYHNRMISSSKSKKDLSALAENTNANNSQ